MLRRDNFLKTRSHRKSVLSLRSKSIWVSISIEDMIRTGKHHGVFHFSASLPCAVAPLLTFKV